MEEWEHIQIYRYLKLYYMCQLLGVRILSPIFHNSFLKKEVEFVEE